jgi:hypothetical protein
LYYCAKALTAVLALWWLIGRGSKLALNELERRVTKDILLDSSACLFLGLVKQAIEERTTSL